MSSKKFFSLLLIGGMIISHAAYCASEAASQPSCPSDQSWVAVDQMCEGTCPPGQAWANNRCVNMDKPGASSIPEIKPFSVPSATKKQGYNK